jgi:hypothetical protein
MYKQAVQFANAFRHLATLLNADRKLFLSSTVEGVEFIAEGEAALHEV